MAELSPHEDSTQRFVARWMIVYALVLFGGVFALRQMALNTALPMNYDRSLFWATSAITCTGFRLTPNSIADFSTAGVVLVHLLSTFGALFAMGVGGVLVSRLAGLTHTPRRIITAAVLLLVGGGLVGALPLLSSGRAFRHALFESTGAIANFGLSLDLYRTPADWRFHMVVLPLAALGALSIPVLLDLYDRFRHAKALSDYSRWVLHVFVAAWLVGFVLMLIATQALPWRESILASWAYALNTRSLGADLGVDLPRQAWWLISILMLVGAPIGGTGSGLRLLPLSVLWNRSALGEKPAQDVSTVRSLTGAAGWLALFAMTYIALLLSMMSAEPQMTTDQLVVISAGALGNTGISQDPVIFSTRGLIICSVGMLAGYLLPLRFAAWIVRPRV